jgi:hypothetical protein
MTRPQFSYGLLCEETGQMWRVDVGKTDGLLRDFYNGKCL